VPSIYIDCGTIKPGRWKGQDLTVVSAFEAVGAYSAGKMSREDLKALNSTLVQASESAGRNIPLTRWRRPRRRLDSAYSIRR
jgi:dihydroxy-acid dehydratase